MSRPPAAPASDDNAGWASSVAEHLPAADVRQLSKAALEGRASVRALRGRAGAAILRNACDQLLGRLRGEEPAYVAGLLAGAAGAVERARQRQSIDVVWTGPETSSGAGRLTAATIIDLIGQARRQILIVSYATQGEPAIADALAAAVERGVEITVVAEQHDDNPGYTAIRTPFPGLNALRLRWPASRRPPGAALHAKIIVVDERIALVGSANFTSRAMESNLECGILVRGGRHPRAISDHIRQLRAHRDLQP